MASIVEDLLKSFELVMKEPWSPSLSGQERIWFLVYDPSSQKRIYKLISEDRVHYVAPADYIQMALNLTS